MTVYRTRQRWVAVRQAALQDKPQSGRRRKLDGKQEAFLVALACSQAPEGRDGWTLQRLADKLRELNVIEDPISYETVRERMKKNDLKPWLKQQWCIPNKIGADFVWRMEDVLDLYAQSWRPTVCFDERPCELRGDVLESLPMKPGDAARYDYEYARHGSCHLCMFFQPQAGWRHTTVTSHRKKADFAECMPDLVDVHFPCAEIMRVVLDNLSTHPPAALYEAFDPPQARRILRSLEFHYTPHLLLG